MRLQDGNYLSQPRYAIDLPTVVINDADGHLEATVNKQLRDGSFVALSLQVDVIEDSNLRIRLDEIDRSVADTHINSKRYDEASRWAFAKEKPALCPFVSSVLDDQISLRYANYEAIIDLYPIRVTMKMDDNIQIVFNERQFLNLEHYRTKKCHQSNDCVHVGSEESTFDAFKDHFKDSRNDRLPLGPESIAADIRFNNYSHVYGIPEHADSFSLKDTTGGEPYRLYNVDIFEYEPQSKLPMYGSIPFMIAVNEVTTAGIFWVNSADTYIDIQKNEAGVPNDKFLLSPEPATIDTHWMSENGILDVILMAKSNSPKEINKSYGKITGFSALPNLFSLGYHQCRWNYNDETDLLDVHEKFDDNDIPYDGIWLDIEYTDQKKYFTWNENQFPNPENMMSKLDETGRNLIVIIDPHLKKGYDISNEVIKKHIGIKNHRTSDTYHGHCWPGESIWIDTLNPSSQPFWDKQFVNGSTLLGHSSNVHLWNDMNEPSVFNGPETTAPKDLIHYGQWEHRSIHNLYGLTYHEATYNSLIKRNPNQRPFILTRSFFAGSQRTVAMWTGDNMSKWEFLRESIPMVLTLNAVGFPFAGADVGGFFGNPSGELLTRWYQTGIWYPFFRAHAHIDSARREPWMPGGEYTQVIKDSIKLRYKLLSLFYTEFWKSSTNGQPIITPLVWEVPQDPKVYDIDDEFYLGGLLVKPVVDEGTSSISMYFPNDGHTYYDFFNLNQKYDAGQTVQLDVQLKDIPVFTRSGSIIPIKDIPRRSSKLMKHDPYHLLVVIDDKSRKAHGELYIDDGESFEYINEEDWLHVDFFADDNERLIQGSVVHNAEGNLIGTLNKVKINKITIVGSQFESEKARIQGGEQFDIISNQDGSLTIRNPLLPINNSWSIHY